MASHFYTGSASRISDQGLSKALIKKQCWLQIKSTTTNFSKTNNNLNKFQWRAHSFWLQTVWILKLMWLLLFNKLLWVGVPSRAMGCFPQRCYSNNPPTILLSLPQTNVKTMCSIMFWFPDHKALRYVFNSIQCFTLWKHIVAQCFNFPKSCNFH